MSSDTEYYDSEIDNQQEEIIQRHITEKDDNDNIDPAFRYVPGIVKCHYCSFRGRLKNYKRHILKKHPDVSKDNVEKNIAETRVQMRNRTTEMRQRLKQFFKGSESKCFLCGRSNRGVKMREHLSSVHGLTGNIVESLVEGKFLSSIYCTIKTCQTCGKKYMCQKGKVVSNHDCPKPVPKTKVCTKNFKISFL